MDEQFSSQPLQDQWQAPEAPVAATEPTPVYQPTPQPVAQKYTQTQRKSSFPTLFALVFTAVVFAAGGYLGAQYYPMSRFLPTPAPTPVTATPTPTPKPTAAPAASPTVISGWGASVIPELKMKLQYPMKFDVFTNIDDQTEFAADNEYWITTAGAGDASPVLWLYLYKSDKAPLAWFESEGIAMYKAYAKQMAAGSETTVTYVSEPVNIDGKEAYDIVVTSKGFEGPKSPIQYVRVLQHDGYIVMTEYDEQGDPETSKKVLSTFDFKE